MFPYICSSETALKGIVSRDFGGLQMILMYRIGVPDVPLKDYYNNTFFLSISIMATTKMSAGMGNFDTVQCTHVNFKFE